jgi:hypothetical protein
MTTWWQRAAALRAVRQAARQAALQAATFRALRLLVLPFRRGPPPSSARRDPLHRGELEVPLRLPLQLRMPSVNPNSYVVSVLV